MSPKPRYGMLSRMPAPTPRTQVHRHPERGDYDRDTIDRILDEALICHVAFNDEKGAPRCLPTIHARVGDTIYLHGSTAARAWKALRAGAEVCIVATIVDGLVMARSAFNHSMNYRSVVVFGTAREVTEEDELHTAVDEASAKVRTGPPKDDEEDIALPIWAGVLPFQTKTGEPDPSPDLAPGIDVPPSVSGYHRPGRR